MKPGSARVPKVTMAWFLCPMLVPRCGQGITDCLGDVLKDVSQQSGQSRSV
jgi:hypothetical protein